MKKLVLAALLLLTIVGCAKEPVTVIEENPVPPVTQPEVVLPEEVRIKVAAAGDNLLHNSVSYSVQYEKDKFDFKPIYKSIKPIIQAHDLAFVNQEIPLAGIAYGIGKYPHFNGPVEAADALLDAGFNIVNVASNHVLDKGLDAALQSYENIKNAGFKNVVGLFPDESDKDKFCIIDKQGIKIGLLSYTYGTNGIPIPKDRPNLVPLIDIDKITADVGKITDQCDVVMVSLHWGNEYQTTPSDQQRQIAQTLADLGVDVVIGHHPHVLQPMEIVSGAKGDMVCIYSLGNFVSNQQKASTMLGGIASFEIVKTPQGEFRVEAPGVTPIVTHYGKGSKSFEIIPLADYTADMAAKHGILSYDTNFSLTYLQNLSAKVLGQYEKK